MESQGVHISYFVLFLICVICVAGGMIGMFFIARKNPEWVQKIYEQQKGITRDVRTGVQKELDEAKAKLAELELDKKIEAKIKELMGK